MVRRPGEVPSASLDDTRPASLARGARSRGGMAFCLPGNLWIMSFPAAHEDITLAYLRRCPSARHLARQAAEPSPFPLCNVPSRADNCVIYKLLCSALTSSKPAPRERNAGRQSWSIHLADSLTTCPSTKKSAATFPRCGCKSIGQAKGYDTSTVLS